MKLLLSLFALAILGCADRPADPTTSIREAEQALEDYRQAWLADDPASVMSHVSDEFVMMTPVRTVSGKEHVRAYWFPSRDTSYPIRKYDVTNQKLYGQGEYVIAEGYSFLAWDTKVKDSVVSSATAKSEYLSVLRKEAGTWRLYRSLFVMR